MEDIIQHANYLKSHGFTILENFLSKEEVILYKNLVKEYFSNGKNRCKGYVKAPTSTLKPDGINDPYFEPMKGIFSNPRLINVIKNITNV